MAWWIPAAAALALGLSLWRLSVAYSRRLRQIAQQYRRLYVQLVSKLEGISTTLTDMQALLPYVGDVKVLDFYESCVKSLEMIVVAVHKLPRFGDDLTQLKTAHILVNNCRDRVERSREAFRKVVKGRPPNYNKLFDWKDEPKGTAGCYFCSKPFRKESFAKVRTKINNMTIEVVGCSVCREELGRTKKIKVLYFIKNGQPVHWSQVSEYVPSESYWELNRRPTVYATPKLELIVSTDSTDKRS